MSFVADVKPMSFPRVRKLYFAYLTLQIVEHYQEELGVLSFHSLAKGSTRIP